MRTVLLASVALVTSSPAPPPPPERDGAPCPRAEAKKEGGGKAEGRLLQSEKPSAAQRLNPGLF